MVNRWSDVDGRHAGTVITARGVFAILLLGAGAAALRAGEAKAEATGGVIVVGERDLQPVIDAAPPNATILCDPNRQMTLSTSIQIRKPLTLRGLNARLPEKLGSTSLVVVTSKGVTICDFLLTGNGDTASQEERAPLMVIGAGDFRVEHGQFFNSSKDGVMISGEAAGADVVGGTVRDIVGREIIRDVVSIGGSGGGGALIRNVLVENIRCYHSQKRGCVEVSDGTDNITVRKVYAEDSIYGVDVQDHREPVQINRNIVLEDIYALRCTNAIRTNNIAIGHANLTVRDITARECVAPIQISHTDNLNLSNVRVLDHHGKGYPVVITNCRGVSVRDVLIENTDHKGPGLLVENCDAALIDGFVLRGKCENLGVGVGFRITNDRAFSGLRISNVFAPDVTDAGITLEAGTKKGTLGDYVISGNLARVADRIKGKRAIIANNLP